MVGCRDELSWISLAAGVASKSVKLQRPARTANGPSGSGAVGFYVDTLPRALLAAVACLILFALFSYVLVLTARAHARVARTLLREPEDPLAEAKDLLRRPGPLPSLSYRTDSGSGPAHEGPAHGRGHEPAARTR